MGAEKNDIKKSKLLQIPWNWEKNGWNWFLDLLTPHPTKKKWNWTNFVQQNQSCSKLPEMVRKFINNYLGMTDISYATAAAANNLLLENCPT